MSDLTPTEQQLLRDSQWTYYAQWLDLTIQERKLRGLPATVEELATEFGTTDRTLRKWKTSDAFQPLLKKHSGPSNPLRSRPLVNLDTARLVPVMSDVPPGLLDMPDPDTGEPVVENDQDLERYWRQKAAQDPRSADVYMKYWGKAAMEREAQAALVKYDELELKDLVVEGLVSVGKEHVITWLAAHGWKVEPL